MGKNNLNDNQTYDANYLQNMQNNKNNFKKMPLLNKILKPIQILKDNSRLLSFPNSPKP